MQRLWGRSCIRGLFIIKRRLGHIAPAQLPPPHIKRSPNYAGRRLFGMLSCRLPREHVSASLQQPLPARSAVQSRRGQRRRQQRGSRGTGRRSRVAGGEGRHLRRVWEVDAELAIAHSLVNVSFLRFACRFFQNDEWQQSNGVCDVSDRRVQIKNLHCHAIIRLA